MIRLPRTAARPAAPAPTAADRLPDRLGRRGRTGLPDWRRVIADARPPPPSLALATLDTAAGGLALDLGLYAVSAAFAAITALTSTLLPHRAWGAVAAVGYLRRDARR